MAGQIDRVGIREEPRLMLPRFPAAPGTVQKDQLHFQSSSDPDPSDLAQFAPSS
jgi:hypothetical protein